MKYEIKDKSCKTDAKCNSVVHRDILLEATSSKKMGATSVSTGNQGGEPTLGQ